MTSRGSDAKNPVHGGVGRVQRRVLAVLRDGPRTVVDLCAVLRPELVGPACARAAAVRRAAGTLARRGFVVWRGGRVELTAEYIARQNPQPAEWFVRGRSWADVE